MFRLIPVDHDPFADPPVNLIPVDHDPFAVGPVAQPADPAMGGAGTAAPQLVPVDHDPFAAARTDALPHIIVHPKSPNAPPDNPADADGIDDWFVPTEDGYPDDWFVPASAAPGTAQPAPGSQPSAANPAPATRPAPRPDPPRRLLAQPGARAARSNRQRDGRPHRRDGADTGRAAGDASYCALVAWCNQAATSYS